MAAVTPAKTAERKLGLKEMLDWMVEDGLMDAPTAAKVGTASGCSAHHDANLPHAPGNFERLQIVAHSCRHGETACDSYRVLPKRSI